MALTSVDLTLLATLKGRLGITAATYDTRLEAAIKAASRMIVGYLGRSLHYDAALVEVVAGRGTTELCLARPPIWSITSIVYSGDTLDSTDYAVRTKDDKYGGIITAPSGWLQTALMDSGGISRRAITDHDDALFTVTYVAGWVTPNQTTPSPNTYSVEALPTEIEEACLMLATYLWSKQGADPTVESESLMSYSVAYGDTASALGSNGMPLIICSMIDSYKILIQS